MNGKRAKQLRRDAAALGGETQPVRYKDYQPPQYAPRMIQGVVMGYMKVSNGVPRTMADCHRRNYKDFKHPERIDRRERLNIE